MIQATAGDTFDAILEGAPTGLEGTIGVRIVDPTTDTTVVARTTAGISEYPAGSGVYGATLTAPAIGANDSPWPVVVLWDTVSGGTPLTPSATFTEELLVYSGAIPTAPVPEGSPYFTVPELRARYPEITEARYSDDRVEETRAAAEEAIEEACGLAFVPREHTETLRSPDGLQLRATRRDLRRVTAAEDADGDEIDISDGVDIDGRWLTLEAGWPLNLGAVTVTYEHGLDAPPRRIKQAAMILTRNWLIIGPVEDRATQMTTQDGGTINLATPGVFGATFGVPEVDAAVDQYRRQSFVG